MDGKATGIDALSSTRLRDLGFEADQVGGRIDHAKAQHHRFLGIMAGPAGPKGVAELIAERKAPPGFDPQALRPTLGHGPHPAPRGEPGRHLLRQLRRSGHAGGPLPLRRDPHKGGIPIDADMRLAPAAF
jgi:hypothetical protein